MYQSERYSSDIFRSEVNWYISIAFIGSFTLAMGLLIWQTAFNDNPLTDVFATAIVNETQLPN